MNKPPKSLHKVSVRINPDTNDESLQKLLQITKEDLKHLSIPDVAENQTDKRTNETKTIN